MLRFPVKNKTPFKVPAYLTIIKDGGKFKPNETILNDTHIKLFGYSLISVVKDMEYCEYDETMLVKMNNSLGFAQGKWTFEPRYKIGEAEYGIKTAFEDYRNGFKYIDENFQPLPQNVKYKKINHEHVYFGCNQGFKIDDKIFDFDFTLTWNNVIWDYVLLYCKDMGIAPPKNKYHAMNNPNIIINPDGTGKPCVLDYTPITQRGYDTIKTKEEAILAAINYNLYYAT